MYAISKMSNGLPDTGATAYHGHVLLKELGQYGLYMFSGSGAQLSGLGGLANVVPLVGMTDDGTARYPELENTISAGARTKMNNWLTARGYPNVPAGWTYRRLLNELLQRFGLDTEEGNWIKDS